MPESATAQISGPAEVSEGDAYVLSLTASSNASTFTVQNWTISYGDGTTHSLAGDSATDLFTYDTPSTPTYEIAATVTGVDGAGETLVASASMSVTVDAVTGATLSLTPDPTAMIQEPFGVTGLVTDGGNHTLTGYTIAWGDGTSDSDSSLPQAFTGSYADLLAHTYAQTGTYDITATAVTEQGTVTATVQVDAQPLLYVDYDPNGYTVGQAFDLTPTFSDPGHTLASYVVSWGDDSASATYPAGTTDFAHAYAADQSFPYEVLITATTDEGTWTDVESLSVAPPTLALTGPSDATQGTTFAITANVTSGETLGSNYNFTIDWGDGSTEQSVAAPSGPLSYDYSEPGTYTVSVEAAGDEGAADFAEATVGVAVATPTVTVAFEDASATAGIAETFTDSFSSAGGDPLDNLTVDWGDGQTDAYYLDPQRVTHVYAHPGTYDVTDTFVTDDGEYTAGTTAAVGDAGSLSVSEDGGTFEGEVFVLTAHLDEPDGQTPTNYHVNWGDDQQDDWGPESQGTFTHVYTTQMASPGYILSVTATTADGTYAATASPGVTVGPSPAALGITAPEIVEGGSDFLLSAFWTLDGQTYDDYPVEGRAATYQVNWGDNQTDTFVGENTFTHQYAYPATNGPNYTVTAFTDEGTVGSRSSGSAVDKPGGSGTINANMASSVTEGQTVTLNASFSDPNQGPDPAEQGADQGWQILWGDGATSVASGGATAAPTHTYSEAGTFTVTAVAGYHEEFPPDWTVTGGYAAQTLVPVTVGPASATVTAVGDTTATVTGDTYSLSLSFSNTFSYVTDYHQPLKWQVAWGDGTSDVYLENLPHDATHVYTTASTSGTNYSPTITCYTDEGTFTPTAAPNVTVAEPLMQVLQSDGSPMDHDAQHTLGAFVTLNDDDDGDRSDSDGNPIPDMYQTSLSTADPDLVPVVLNALPGSVGGTFSVSWPSGNFDLYADPYKDQAVSSGQTFDATVAHTVWIEGSNLSSGTADPGNVLAVSWTDPSGNHNVANVDSAKVNVAAISGAKYVPANGRYTYRLVGDVPAPDMDSWSFTGGTKVSETGGGEGVIVSWDQGAVFGTVQVVVDQRTVRLPVSVFAIQVGTGTFNHGTPADAGAPHAYSPYFPAMSKFVTSGNAANPGLSWTAPITVSGPVKPGAVNPDDTGIGNLRVGFIQNVVKGGYTNVGFYTGGGQRTSSSDAYFQTYGPVLDGPAGAGPNDPWYAPPWTPSLDQPSTPKNAPRSAHDIPKAGTPLDFQKQADLAAVAKSPNPLLRTDVENSFALYVCAETTDATNGANLVYVAEAEGDWKFNGSGTIGKAPAYPWKSFGAGVTPPAGWSPAPANTILRTGGMIGNDVIEAAIFR